MKARNNPFSTEKVLKIRYKISEENIEKLLNKLELINYRGAIVGPEGSGKTTLLEDIAPFLQKRGFRLKNLLLNREKKGFPKDFISHFYKNLSSEDIILFDGAEQLSWLSWQIFKRKSAKAGGLIITSHNAGLLTTVYECSTTPELFCEIVEMLIGKEGKKIKELSKKIIL